MDATELAERVCVSLEGDNLTELVRAVRAVKGMLHTFRVGIDLYAEEGIKVVERLVEENVKVVVDLRFVEGPAPLAHAVKALSRLRPTVITLSLCCGPKALGHAVESLAKEPAVDGHARPHLYGATLMLDDLQTAMLGFGSGAGALATVAVDAKLDGILCHANEVREIREVAGKDVKLLAQVDRHIKDAEPDAAVVASAAQALRTGANMVLLPPTTGLVKDPRKGAEDLIASLGKAV